jgi:hypothetical protein
MKYFHRTHLSPDEVLESASQFFQASLAPVEPFARLEVGPDDFPFLKDIRGIDDARLREYGEAMQAGAPWPE